MRETEIYPGLVSMIVRLTQLIAIDHFLIVSFEKHVSKLTQIMSDQSVTFSKRVTLHVVSICPLTKCPSIRSFALRHLSILKKSQILFLQKFVLLRDSCMTKKLYVLSLKLSTVIQAPSWAIDCPICMSDQKVFSKMNFHASIEIIFDFFSIIPVNMYL